MKILEIKPLSIPDVLVIRFGRFRDHRGYFTEPYRFGDLAANPLLSSLAHLPIVQSNESYSKPMTLRGLHFQWNPYMGKLIRTLTGRMVDIALDIRKGSPTNGKIIGYNMPASRERDFDEWLWIPPGFAHGNFFPEESLIEYLCTGEYSPACEATISPLSSDLDWTLCHADIQNEFRSLVTSGAVISAKDQSGYTLTEWLKDRRSDYFVYIKHTP